MTQTVHSAKPGLLFFYVFFYVLTLTALCAAPLVLTPEPPAEGGGALYHSLTVLFYFSNEQHQQQTQPGDPTRLVCLFGSLSSGPELAATSAVTATAGGGTLSSIQEGKKTIPLFFTLSNKKLHHLFGLCHSVCSVMEPVYVLKSSFSLSHTHTLAG